jgi:uncharacterized cofD-like protein
VNARRKFWLSLWRWLVPGLRVKRYLALVLLGVMVLMGGFVAWTRVGEQRNFFINFTARLIEISEMLHLGRWGWAALLMVVGIALGWWGVIGLNRSLLRSLGSSPSETLDRIFTTRALGAGPKIAAIGGGTGLSNLLSGLKRYSSNITAIVAVTDDGGSSGRLRKSLDMPAPGDLIDCYAALSDSPDLAKLLLHRFARGEELEGHTFGNLMLATLSEDRKDFSSAILALNNILNVRGQVLPATASAATLMTELEDGTIIAGESTLREQTAGRRVKRSRLEPSQPKAMQGAVETILNAEMIVIGPGSLYTSVIPPLLVPDLARAIKQSKAAIVYVANIMTEHGETDHLSLFEHCQAVTLHLGRKPDVVLVNNAPISRSILEKYFAEKAEQVKLDLASTREAGIQIHQARLTQNGEGQHQPRALSAALIRILLEKRLRPGRTVKNIHEPVT